MNLLPNGCHELASSSSDYLFPREKKYPVPTIRCAQVALTYAAAPNNIDNAPQVVRKMLERTDYLDNDEIRRQAIKLLLRAENHDVPGALDLLEVLPPVVERLAANSKHVQASARSKRFADHDKVVGFLLELGGRVRFYFSNTFSKRQQRIQDMLVYLTEIGDIELYTDRGGAVRVIVPWMEQKARFYTNVEVTG